MLRRSDIFCLVQKNAWPIDNITPFNGAIIRQEITSLTRNCHNNRICLTTNSVLRGLDRFDPVPRREFRGENEEFKEGWRRLVFWPKCDHVLSEIAFGDGYNDFGEIAMNGVAA